MPRPIALLIVLAALLAACGGGGAASPSASPSEAPTAPSPSDEPTAAPSEEPSADPSDSPGPRPSDEPGPDPVLADIPLDTLIETIVDDLNVRREPGTAGERIGFLELGTTAFVIAGPEVVDGIPWYRVTGMGLPYGSGCVTVPPTAPIVCPAFQGWVAGGSEAGDPWLAATDPDPCPEPDIRTMSEAGFTWRLVCWADGPITFEAYWPEIPDDAGLGGACLAADDPGGYLFCQNINYNQLSASPEEGFVSRLGLSIDPDSGLSMPERGQWLRVTGSFDHPDAEACAAFADPEFEDESGAVFGCRLQFVPTAIEPLGA